MRTDRVSSLFVSEVRVGAALLDEVLDFSEHVLGERLLVQAAHQHRHPYNQPNRRSHHTHARTHARMHAHTHTRTHARARAVGGGKPNCEQTAHIFWSTFVVLKVHVDPGDVHHKPGQTLMTLQIRGSHWSQLNRKKFLSNLAHFDEYKWRTRWYQQVESDKQTTHIPVIRFVRFGTCIQQKFRAKVPTIGTSVVQGTVSCENQKRKNT